MVVTPKQLFTSCNIKEKYKALFYWDTFCADVPFRTKEKSQKFSVLLTLRLL